MEEETVENPAPVEDDVAAAPEAPAPPEEAPAVVLGTYELLRAPGAADEPVAAPDDDVTSEVLSRPRRSVWGDL